MSFVNIMLSRHNSAVLEEDKFDKHISQAGDKKMELLVLRQAGTHSHSIQFVFQGRFEWVLDVPHDWDTATVERLVDASPAW